MVTTRQSELVALLGGGDWADASVGFIKVPLTIDIEHARSEYDDWYTNHYLPAYRTKDITVIYHTFESWLCTYRGATQATPQDIAIIEE